MAPPWVLDYVKMTLQGLVEEGIKKAAGRVLAGDAPPDNPYAREYKDSDRASTAQRDAAMKHFLTDLKFREVYLPAQGAYFGQNDKRWAEHPYPSKDRPPTAKPSTRIIGDAGCAPSALAIAHTTLLETPATPEEIADFAVAENLSSNRPAGHKDGPGGTDIEVVERWANQHGLDVKATKNLDTLRDAIINSGAVAVVQVKGGIFNLTDQGKLPKSGHVIAVNGYAVDEDGKEWFFVANPGMHGRAIKYADALAKEGVIVEKDLKHQGVGMVRVSREVLEDYMKGGGAHILTKQP
jgi:hypothetical protein